MTSTDRQVLEASILRRCSVLWLIFACVAGAAAFWLYEHYRNPTYRYKLTMSVDTADGVMTAFNVVEVEQVWVYPDEGVISRTRGEALYIDLGPTRRPLVVLMTRKFRIPGDRRLRGLWGEADHAGRPAPV